MVKRRQLYDVLGRFNPTLGQIWTDPAIGLNFYITFLTQCLGLSIFDPKVGLKQPSILSCIGVRNNRWKHWLQL